MSEAEAREEMWLDDHTYAAKVVCGGCGDVADRLIVDDDGEAYRGCENVIGAGRQARQCQATHIERELEQ